MRRRVRASVNVDTAVSRLPKAKILEVKAFDTKNNSSNTEAINNHDNSHISNKEQVSKAISDMEHLNNHKPESKLTTSAPENNGNANPKDKLNLVRRRVTPNVNVPIVKRPIPVAVNANSTSIGKNGNSQHDGEIESNSSTDDSFNTIVDESEEDTNSISAIDKQVKIKTESDMEFLSMDDESASDTNKSPESIKCAKTATAKVSPNALKAPRWRVKPVANIAKVQRIPRRSSETLRAPEKGNRNNHEQNETIPFKSPHSEKSYDSCTVSSPGKVVEVLSNATSEKDNIEVSLQSIKGSAIKSGIAIAATKCDDAFNKSPKKLPLNSYNHNDSFEEEERSESDVSEIVLPNTDESMSEFLENTLNDSQTAATLKNMDITEIINDIENAAATGPQQDAAKQSYDSTSTDDESAPEKIKRQDHSFKYPLAVKYNRGNATSVTSGNIDDYFNAAVPPNDDNIIQMDLQRLNNYPQPMSPSKGQANRQRVRPAPVIQQRRNSLIESMSSPQSSDEIYGTMQPSPSRRDKIHPSPYNQSVMSPLGQVHSPQKPHSRTRTESNCSVYSDAGQRRSRYKNEDHMQRLDYEARFSNGVPDKNVMKMSDLIFYNPESNPMKQSGPGIDIKEEKSSNLGDPSDLAKIEKVEPEDQKNVPQLKLNEHGEIILDDTSLEIETSTEQLARKVLANSSLIVLDENTGMNGFYTRQKRTRDWTADQTLKFYRCLQTIGTDFSLMVELFPDRTRRDLKLKFKKEERVNNALINKALLNPKKFDVQELKEHLLEEERRVEYELKNWKNIKTKQPKEAKKIRTYKSRAERSLQHGDFIYQNENVTKEQFKKRTRKSKDNLDKSTKDASAATVADETANTDVATKIPKPRRKKIKTDEPPPPIAEIIAKAINSAETAMEKDNNTYEQIVMSQILDDSGMDNDFSGNLQTFLNSDNSLGNDTPSTSAGIVEQPSVENHRTLMNLDDGSLTNLPDNLLTANDEPNPHEIDESDIQQILSELEKGNLALVSMADPNNPERVINEIYMTEPNGNPFEKALDLPQEIINSIVSVIFE